MEDDTKKTRPVKRRSELRKCSDEVAQETEVCNSHKDEDMNAQENANMNEIVATNASVHVISGATMGMSGQWQDSLRRKRRKRRKTHGVTARGLV